MRKLPERLESQGQANPIKEDLALSARKFYFNDLILALSNQGLTKAFEVWADKHCPDAPTYFDVLAEIAAERTMEQLYIDIMGGKFEEEITNEMQPVPVL